MTPKEKRILDMYGEVYSLTNDIGSLRSVTLGRTGGKYELTRLRNVRNLEREIDQLKADIARLESEPEPAA